MKRIYVIFILAVFIAPYSLAQDKVVDRIIEIGTTDGKAMEHLDYLTNIIGGRPIGSDAYLNATEWAKRTFESWGLEVEVEKVGELPVGFNRGPWFGRMLSEDGKELHFVTPSYTRGTHGRERGHVVKEPRTTAEFQRMKGVLNGAWVLVSGQSHGWEIGWDSKADSARALVIAANDSIAASDPKSRKPARDGTQIKYYEYPALFYKQMVEAGVRGFIQSAKSPITALYDYNIRTGFLTEKNLPPVPNILMDEKDYNLISEKVSRRDYFLLEFDIRNHFKPGPVPYSNVIVTIKGSKYPDELVMAGGHLDSFDVATGGVDCGSGVTLNMEAARLLALAMGKQRPLRTIKICLWAGEEFGLIGSKYWVENHKESLPKISNYFNRDGGPTCATSITVTPAMKEMMEPLCKPLSKIDSRFPFELKIRQNPPGPRPTKAGGSDHAYFAKNGVPTIGFDLTDPLGLDFQYWEIWHTERDTYDKSIEPYQQHSAIVTAVMLWQLANAKTILPRTDLYTD